MVYMGVEVMGVEVMVCNRIYGDGVKANAVIGVPH